MVTEIFSEVFLADEDADSGDVDLVDAEWFAGLLVPKLLFDAFSSSVLNLFDDRTKTVVSIALVHVLPHVDGLGVEIALIVGWKFIAQDALDLAGSFREPLVFVAGEGSLDVVVSLELRIVSVRALAVFGGFLDCALQFTEGSFDGLSFVSLLSRSFFLLGLGSLGN